MNLKALKNIIDAEHLPDNVKEEMILIMLAADKKVIPHILTMLSNERKFNEELIIDQNVELSRALLVLKDSNLKWNKKIVCDPSWVVEQIKQHYEKYKDVIKCTFKIDG